MCDIISRVEKIVRLTRQQQNKSSNKTYSKTIQKTYDKITRPNQTADTLESNRIQI